MCGTTQDPFANASSYELPSFSVAESSPPDFAPEDAAFVADARHAFSDLGTPNWSGVDLADQLRDAADRAEELTRERDEALDEVNRLEAELNAVEEDKFDLDTLDAELRTAEAEISGLNSELSSVRDKVDNLRYVDLEDVMDSIDSLSSDLYDVEQAVSLVETAVADARTELERS